jgi:hypothetical protein
MAATTIKEQSYPVVVFQTSKFRLMKGTGSIAYLEVASLDRMGARTWTHCQAYSKMDKGAVDHFIIDLATTLDHLGLQIKYEE